jgi:hypothetical protein
LTKNNKALSKKILLYGLDSLNDDSDNMFHLYIKSLLVNTKIILMNQIDLDLLLSLVLYISKYDNIVYFNQGNENNGLTYYYVVKK